jgi:D-amino-acid oxidase
LTCGVTFAECGYRTSIFAEESGPRITSAAAGAIWFPYDAEPANAVIAWSLETFDILRELSGTPGVGVSMLEMRAFARAGELEIPPWALPLGAHRLAPVHLPACFSSGYALVVPLMDTTIYLYYLAARFRSAGGEIQVGVHLDHLDEVNSDYSLVVNCTGVGAKSLVPDPEVEPHRGQVTIVPRMPLSHAVVCDDPPLMYAIPRTNDCVFGGTNELSADLDPDSGTTARIIAECSRVLEIDPPKVVRECVGLRPFRRTGICLRADQLRDGRRVIHNYGHGGSGFTLSWGCARAVLSLAETV